MKVKYGKKLLVQKCLFSKGVLVDGSLSKTIYTVSQKKTSLMFLVITHESIVRFS